MFRIQRQPVLRVAALAYPRGKAGIAAKALRACGLAFLCAIAAPAWAASPVAIVEQVEGAVPGVLSLDYLVKGQSLALPEGGKIVLSYFSSCMHETITGAAMVLVGVDQSVAPESSVQRKRMPCDAGNMTITTEESQAAAGLIDRGLSEFESGLRPTPRPQAILYGSSPVILAPAGEPLTVERIGGSASHEVLETELHHGVAAYDYASHGRALIPGALYRARRGKRAIIFRVSPDAASGPTPLIGRVLVF